MCIRVGMGLPMKHNYIHSGACKTVDETDEISSSSRRVGTLTYARNPPQPAGEKEGEPRWQCTPRQRPLARRGALVACRPEPQPPPRRRVRSRGILPRFPAIPQNHLDHFDQFDFRPHSEPSSFILHPSSLLFPSRSNFSLSNFRLQARVRVKEPFPLHATRSRPDPIR